jgi:acetyl-CoA carboxylase beta subunit
MQEKLGNVVFNLIFHLYKYCNKCSSLKKEMYYITVSMHVEVLIMVCHIKSQKTSLRLHQILDGTTRQNWQIEEVPGYIFC